MVDKEIEDDVLLALCATVCTVVTSSPRKRYRGPDRKWIRRREKRGTMNTLIQELRLEDASSYRNWMRMNEECFTTLLNIIHPDIEKKNTILRAAIKPSERLAVTLKFLATGMSFREISYIFRIGERTVSNIIHEVCQAIFKRLNYTFYYPSNENDWKNIASNFWIKCNMPNCLGAIDGKHIILQKPKHSGSHYHNYKGSESIVLMAVADSNLIFRYIDVGINGRISDGGVWDRCKFNHLLRDKKLSLPSEEKLPGSHVKINYYFVADDAFPLSCHIMKPFPGKNMSERYRIFNYRLSRARRCVECSFGILANRFRVFLTKIALQPKRVKDIVLAACSLHNYLISNSPGYTSNSSQSEIEQEENFENLAPTFSRNSTTEAKTMREKLCDYFLTDAGKISWQPTDGSYNQ